MKNIKLLASAIIICSSILSIAPVSAATENSKNTNVDKTVSIENINADINIRSGERIPIKGNEVCLRKTAGLNGTVLRLLYEKNGDAVAYIDYTLISKDGYKWAHVTYFTDNGKQISGYVATKYLY